MAQRYEPDEFDSIAAQGGPIGVHRAPRPWWARLLPPLLAFVIAGLVALGLVIILWNQDIVGPNVAPTPTVTVTSDASPSPSPEPTVTAPGPAVNEPTSPEPDESASEPDPTPTQTEEPEPVVLTDAQIHVRNGANIQGLAGEQQEVLESAGYTNIEANNIRSSQIPGGVNVVTYSDARLADTAQAVADALGIEAVDGGGTPGGAEIEVLLAQRP